MASPGENGKLSFERDIKPLFRAKDRDSMMAAFDLFDYGDVVDNADAIVGSLRSGQMPCDGRVARIPGPDAAAVDRRGHARLSQSPVSGNGRSPDCW